MPRFFSKIGKLWTTSACAVVVMAASLATYFSLPGHRPRDFVLRSMQRRVSQLPETEVLPQVRRIAGMGGEGAAAAAHLLSSVRVCESEAAQAALAEELERWRLLPPRESTPRVIVLARAVAADRDRLGAQNPRYMADLATQFLLWPADNAAQSNELLELSGSILRSVTNGERERERSTSEVSTAIEGPPRSALPRQEAPAVLAGMTEKEIQPIGTFQSAPR